MKILFTASEAVPYCKTGGLADVAGALPQNLAQHKQSVVVVLPLYKAIDRAKHKLKKTTHKLSISVGDSKVDVEIWQVSGKSKVKTYFIGADFYFNRDGLYGPVPGTDHSDNDQRFSLFSRACLELAKKIKFKPDVVHCHDWQTGLIPALLKTVYRSDPFFENTGSLFTIHNLAYQGIFHSSSFAVTGLPHDQFSPNGLEFYGRVNFMKGGLAYADALSTVSPTYAEEITTQEFGYGLDGLLRHRSSRLKGILNGLDTEAWNPKHDPFVATNFDPATLRYRSSCKSDLQKIAGFKGDKSIPLLGFVGRLDLHKGVHFILEMAPALLKQKVQLVILGVGNRELQEKLTQLQRSHRTQVFFETAFAEPLAHKIYAGTDIFLMPSLFEPCGLGQMIAMRFGSLPVVTPTGGLKDTVEEGIGFVSKERTAASFFHSVEQALQAWNDTEEWKIMQKRAMKKDFSWDASIPHYVELYEKARAWNQILTQ